MFSTFTNGVWVEVLSAFVSTSHLDTASGQKTLSMWFHKLSAGIASIRNPASRAIISASVELCETAPCFLQSQVIGQKVFGPANTRKAPVVLLESFKSPAKDASVKKKAIM